MNKFSVMRVPSVITVATLAFVVFQYGTLTIEKVGSHIATPVSSYSSTQALEHSDNIAAKEQQILRDAAKAKLEDKKKDAEKTEKVSKPKATMPKEEKAQPKPADSPPTPVAPVVAPVEVPAAETYVQPPAPVAVPVVAAPVVPVAPPVVKPVPAPVAVPYSLPVYVGLSGGQETVDLCAGPVLFTTSGLPYPYVAEHENCGGWARFSGLQVGSRVSLSGLVAGEFSVGQILTVNKRDTTAALTFGSSPRAILQTCIPGTNQMLVYGLY